MNLTVINLEILKNCYNTIVLLICECQMEYRTRKTGIPQKHRYREEGQEKERISENYAIVTTDRVDQRFLATFV